MEAVKAHVITIVYITAKTRVKIMQWNIASASPVAEKTITNRMLGLNVMANTSKFLPKKMVGDLSIIFSVTQ